MFQQELTINPPSHQPDAATVTATEAAGEALTLTNTQPRPTSARKLASARANGAKSHGPTTPEGRAKCASSAALQITHGMLAQTIVIPGESEPRFLALLARCVDTHNPVTEAELDAVRRMAVATWRQLRVWSFQSLDIAREIARQDPIDAAAPAPFRASLAFRALCLDEANTQAVAHRYEGIYERQYYRAFKTLLDLKTHHRSPTAGLASTAAFTLGSTWETDDMEAVTDNRPAPEGSAMAPEDAAPNQQIDGRVPIPIS